MAGPNRSANRGESRHSSSLRRWARGRMLRAGMVIAVCIFSVLWLLGSAQLSSVHSFTGRHCETCHASVVEARFMKLGIRSHVKDAACLSCHQAPAHHAAYQTF